MKKLSVIIVNYNVCHFLEQALASVKKATEGMEAEVFVVDNNSVDGSVEMVRRRFPFVKLIENKVNVGFSKANNQAMREATGEYVLLLNPDTVVEEDTFTRCCTFMDEHPEAGGLGVKMLDGRGNFLPESKRGLPTPWVAFYKVFGLAALFPRSRRFGAYHLGYLDKDEIHSIQVLSGAYMMLRKSVLDKIGLLDEDYFMYGEDIDLSYRVLKAGYKNYYYPETRIIHYKGESTKRTSINYVFIFYKAMIIFARKHFSQKHAGVFSFLVNIAIYIRAILAIGNRFLKYSILPLADAAVTFGGIYVIKNIWESSYKPEPGKFPKEYMTLAVPIYIVIWLGSVYFNSGYKSNVKIHRLVRGILIGTILIAALSNFADEYRYSKAMTVLGASWCLVSMLSIRYLVHLVRFRNLDLGGARKKRILIVGNAAESARIIELLRETKYKLEIAGYVSPNPYELREGKFIGGLEKMDESILIHKIDEIIFCSKDVPAHRIIEWMTKVNYNKHIEFKIAPDESNYIIGSNSKNKPGDFYTLNLDLNILKEENIRNKRALDIALSLIFLPLSPILMWFTHRPSQFIRNIFVVMGGEYSWVGFSGHEQVNLPKIKKGVIHPASRGGQNLQEIHQLNLRYARDYTLYTDLKLILHSFRYLGV